MNQSSSVLDDDLLAPALALEIDHICDRFESAWKAGQQPPIEQFLNEGKEQDRSGLLHELLILDLSYRRLRGQSCSPEEYQRRFPDRKQLIGDVFDKLDARSTPFDGAGCIAAMPTLPYGPGWAGRLSSRTDSIPVTAIGKYRVLERLGAGGQGEVFRAVHPNLPGREVVIKWARQSLPADKQNYLLAEGQVLARLDDPGLVRVYDVDVHQGCPFVVFEYVAGRSLNDQLKQGRPTFRESAMLVAQLAATLARVHDQGVLHRDLKPHNILIDTAGRPRLLDFGLAWLRPPLGVENDRADRSISGTPQYMPPEQASGQTNLIGPPSDVFGLGAVLYELLTGQPPYQDADRFALWEKARRGQVVPARKVNERVPRALNAICMKALAADPAQRYASARQLQRALLRYVHRPRRVILSAAAVVLLLAGITAWASFPGRTDSGQSGAATTPSIAEAPLAGDLSVRLWSADGSKSGRLIDMPGALPARPGELVHIEVQLKLPAYSYILLLDSQGMVNPLYPWKPGANLVNPPVPALTAEVHSPPQLDRGWALDDNSGLETVLLLARRTPLPADYDLAAKIGKLQSVPLRHPEEYASLAGDRWESNRSQGKTLHRGFTTEAKKIDEPLLAVFERLRPDFELIRAVRFAHTK
jgi:serine/threonine protein kinase